MTVRVNPFFPFYTEMSIFMPLISLLLHTQQLHRLKQCWTEQRKNGSGMSDNTHWATQLSWLFYTCSHNFRLLFMALTLPCDWSEHTLQWHNWHAWPCCSRIRHISLLQHTSKLLIFLSLHLSETKQLGLLIAQGQEDKVDHTSNVRGRLPSHMAQDSDRNEQCWPCAYRNTS